MAGKRKRYPRSKAVISRVLARDQYACRICSSYSSLEVHHIVPLHKGGEDTVENAVTLCKMHHSMITVAQNSKRGQIDPQTGLPYKSVWSYS